jgi:hypothetical protein
LTNRYKNNVLEKRILMWETNIIEDSIESLQYKDIEESSNVFQILINLGLFDEKNTVLCILLYTLILTITLLLACLIIFQVQKLKKL